MQKQDKLSELERRVGELERRVKELETRPTEHHFHYHPPVYVQPYAPAVPDAAPINPPWRSPWVTTTHPYPMTNVVGTAVYPPQGSVNFH